APRAAICEEAAAAREHARSEGACVVKLDGLAAGKGVIVADDGAAAAAAVDELWKPGARLLIEERLRGREVSIIALCDGENVVPLPPARDHKRLLDGDRGPNTGGMGAVCPPADATQELIDLTVRTILEPTARGPWTRSTAWKRWPPRRATICGCCTPGPNCNRGRSSPVAVASSPWLRSAPAPGRRGRARTVPRLASRSPECRAAPTSPRRRC